MGKKKLGFEIGNATDVGCVREHNEDSFACMEPVGRKQAAERGFLLVVCDGMGGAVGGKTASGIAAEAIPEVYYSSNHSHASAALEEAIRDANRRIFKRAKDEPDLSGMGTTTVAAAISGGKALIAHVGDSRCYLIRDGEIGQVTEDHTIVQKMVSEGLLTPEQARNHPEGHILSRSVGVAADLEIDLQEPIELREGDALLLCSDGLTGLVDDAEILDAASSKRPQEAAGNLIELAKERGGPDNITVQIIRAVIGSPAKHGDTTMTTTIRTKALRPRRWPVLVTILIILLLLAAAGLWLVWLYEFIDFNSLLNIDWIPTPPEHLPPLK
ncbi:MAG TPA: Stp1/IreP family PP2C-type Ser/Thr phosphatase [Acidobacteriota bacterium]|nr:Stp1/IreP family PP2C-type Ser/Thr phosphatase [Acidobacteriota bacterium]